MSSVTVGGGPSDDVLRVDADGTVTISPTCIAYPNDESGYTGDLVHPAYGVTISWMKGQGFVMMPGFRVCIGDAIYEALQHGLLQVGIRRNRIAASLRPTLYA